ncbi:hypothetical protein [Paenibacillus pini]|nr:hypothetical protein [Paenibacillus pini]
MLESPSWCKDPPFLVEKIFLLNQLNPEATPTVENIATPHFIPKTITPIVVTVNMYKTHPFMRKYKIKRGVLMSIWDNWKYEKPEWEIHFEFYESRILERTGVSRQKLKELIELLKEYQILSTDQS